MGWEGGWGGVTRQGERELVEGRERKRGSGREGEGEKIAEEGGGEEERGAVVGACWLGSLPAGDGRGEGWKWEGRRVV